MSKRLSTDEAFGRIKAKHPNIEILSKEYKNNFALLKVRCKICNREWQTTSANLFHSGSGCALCKGKLKLSTDEAFGRIKTKHPNIEILSKVYVKNSDSLKLRCEVCNHLWQACYANLIQGNTGCPKCSYKKAGISRRHSTGKAFGDIKEKHPNIQILSRRYEKCGKPLSLKCKVCSFKWQASYSNLVQGNTGCPRCSRQRVSDNQRLSQKEAFERIKEKHPDIQILSKKYISCHSSLSLKCRKCEHKWKTSLVCLIQGGTRCPKCARKMTKGEKMIFDLLISCGLTYCSSLEEALAHEKKRLKCINS